MTSYLAAIASRELGDTGPTVSSSVAARAGVIAPRHIGRYEPWAMPVPDQKNEPHLAVAVPEHTEPLVRSRDDSTRRARGDATTAMAVPLKKVWPRAAPENELHLAVAVPEHTETSVRSRDDGTRRARGEATAAMAVPLSKVPSRAAPRQHAFDAGDLGPMHVDERAELTPARVATPVVARVAELAGARASLTPIAHDGARAQEAPIPAPPTEVRSSVHEVQVVPATDAPVVPATQWTNPLIVTSRRAQQNAETRKSIESAAAHDASPAVVVTIGRIEVRAVQAPRAARAERIMPMTMSLEDYLSERSRGLR